MSINFKHSKVESAPIKISNDKSNILLDMPIENIDKNELPDVTIITITRNRKAFFPLAIDNWNRIYYPHDKLTWLVVDDSDDIEQGPVRQLKSLQDNRISYYYLPPPNNSKGHNIGYKRNFAMGLTKTEYIVMMDDDDYLYNESVLARVCLMKFYNKECVYSDQLGIYDIKNESSYVAEKFLDVPEGSLALTKTFWEQQKFGENENISEGMNLVNGRELKMLKIPYYFNLIVINHKNNTSQRSKNIRFKKDKNKLSKSTPINFFHFFPDTFKQELSKLKSE